MMLELSCSACCISFSDPDELDIHMGEFHGNHLFDFGGSLGTFEVCRDNAGYFQCEECNLYEIRRICILQNHFECFKKLKGQLSDEFEDPFGSENIQPLNDISTGKNGKRLSIVEERRDHSPKIQKTNQDPQSFLVLSDFSPVILSRTIPFVSSIVMEASQLANEAVVTVNETILASQSANESVNIINEMASNNNESARNEEHADREAEDDFVALGDLIASFGFQWLPSCNALLCLECKLIFGVNFSGHYENTHCKRKIGIMTLAQKELIKSKLNQPCLYLGPRQSLLPPISGMDIIDGYSCDDCFFYSKDREYMRKHSKTHSNQGKFRPCKLQIKEISGFRQTYFGVDTSLPCIGTTSHSIDDVPAEANNTNQARKFMDSVFEIEYPNETPPQINIFYRNLEWSDEAIIRMFPGRERLQELPKSGEDGYDAIVYVKNTLLSILDYVKGADISIKFELSDNPKEPFGYLQTEKTRLTYAQNILHLLWFVRQLVHVGGHEIPVDIRDKINLAWSDHVTITRLVDCFIAILSEAQEGPDSLFIKFFKCICLKADLSRKTADNISQMAATIIYFARAVCVWKACETPVGMRQMVCAEVKKLTTVDNFNSFSKVCLLKGMASNCDRAQFADENVVESKDGKTFTVQGHDITLEALRTGYEDALKYCESLIDQLKLGYTGSIDISEVHDNIKWTESGACVKAHKDNAHDRIIRESLANYLFDDSQLRSKYLSRNSVGDYVPLKEPAGKYLKLYDKYLQTLLFVLHVGSGMPARGSEFNSATIMSGKTGTRSLFYVDGQIYFKLLYNKTSSITGQNRPIARFCDERVSKMILEDLFLVRPLAAKFSEVIYASSKKYYGTQLFLNGGEPMTDDQFRSTFARQFAEFTKSTLSIAQYRHFAKFLGNKFAIKDIDTNIIDESENAFHSQIGHSKVTADRRYGRGANEMGDLRTSTLFDYRKMSDIWSQIVIKGIGIKVDKFEEENIVFCEPTISQKLSLDIVEEQACQDLILESDFLPVTRGGSMLNALRVFLRNPTAKFSSTEQRLACEYLLETENDQFVVIPTGEGKSLLFFLYAFISKKSSIVIVPTLSLIADLSRRATSHGISFSVDYNSFSGELLLFLTPESLASSKVGHLVSNLSANGMFGKIFIDECHQYCTDEDYRLAFCNFELLGSQDVPLVLMTATAPGHIVKEIFKNIFGSVRRPVVTRGKTVKRNIRFSVKDGDPLSELIDACRMENQRLNADDRIIIYVKFRDEASEISECLKDFDINSSIYHAGQPEEINLQAFDMWRNGHTKFMIATTAFGVGIDFRTVREVFFFGLPYSLEDYVQQVGRAGRDGKLSFSTVFFNIEKERKLASSLPEHKRNAVEKMLFYACSTKICRRRILTRYFDGTETDCLSAEDAAYCDVCDGSVSLPKNVVVKVVAKAKIDSQKSGEKALIEKFAMDLLFFAEKYRTNCVYCLVYGSDPDVPIHSFRQCPKLVEKCFRCLGDRHECKIKTKWMNDVCSHCYLPKMNLGGIEFHKHVTSCSDDMKDHLKVFAMAVTLKENKRYPWNVLYERTGLKYKLWEKFIEMASAAETSNLD